VPDLRPLDDVTAELSTAESGVADVEVALTRIDDGTYGTCEVCSEALPGAVLEAAPASRTCARHGSEPGPRR